MKKIVLAGLILTLGLVACSDSASVKIKVDSVGKKFDTTAERLYDTAKGKMKDLKERIEDRVNDRDTVNRN